MVTWRLLITGTADGPTNMAVDQAIMEAVAAERVPPTLRFYAWQPACRWAIRSPWPILTGNDWPRAVGTSCAG
jgi:hypothetical protein